MTIKNIILFCIQTIFASSAFASLQVFPLRVVLTDNNRNAQVSLRHKGNSKMKYRITTVYYEMLKDGSMRPLPDSSAVKDTAEKFFRFSPKQVLLEPDVEQIVRLSLRMPGDTPDGEYRVHLRFEEESSAASQDAEGSQNAMLSLKAKMAVAIPIIVRKGRPSVSVKLEDLKFIKNKEKSFAFSVELTKEGTANAYGDFEVVSVDKDDKQKVIGQINGVSSYIEKRLVSFPLAEEPSVPGKLILHYKKPVSDGGEIMATTQIDLK